MGDMRGYLHRLGYWGFIIRLILLRFSFVFYKYMSVCPWVLPSLPMQFLLNNLMKLNESYRKFLIPYHFLFRFVFVDFVLFSLAWFYFVFISLISFRFVSFLLISFRFVSFRFRWFRSVRFVSISFRTLYVPSCWPSLGQ
jgi:hypothetical protein